MVCCRYLLENYVVTLCSLLMHFAVSLSPWLGGTLVAGHFTERAVPSGNEVMRLQKGFRDIPERLNPCVKKITFWFRTVLPSTERLSYRLESFVIISPCSCFLWYVRLQFSNNPVNIIFPSYFPLSGIDFISDIITWVMLFFDLLGAFTKLRKAIISFVTCPSVRPHVTFWLPLDMCEIWYLKVFRKSRGN